MTENKRKHQKKKKYSENFDFNLTKPFLKMEKDTTLLCCWFEVMNNQKIDKKICKMQFFLRFGELRVEPQKYTQC